jgi:hypothetical protein
MVLEIPRKLGIAPATANIAASYSDKVSCLAHMKSFALNCIKLINQWEFVTVFK